MLPVDTNSIYISLMKRLGYDVTDSSTDIETPTGIGNVACAAVLEFRPPEGEVFIDLLASRLAVRVASEYVLHHFELFCASSEIVVVPSWLRRLTMCVLRRPSCVYGYTVLFVVALCTPARPQQPVPQQRSIEQVFEEDQRDRQHLDYSKLSKEDWQKIQARDAARREETKQLVASGAAKTGEDYRDAAFIFQHGDKSEDFLLAHVLGVAAIAKGDVTATWVSAATLDRYLQSLKQPQVFGTQYVLKDPNAVLKNPKAPRMVTQDPYDKNVLSDALRNVYCVLPYAVQQQNVEAMNKGQNPQPDSCH